MAAKVNSLLPTSTSHEVHANTQTHTEIGQQYDQTPSMHMNWWFINASLKTAPRVLHHLSSNVSDARRQQTPSRQCDQVWGMKSCTSKCQINTEQKPEHSINKSLSTQHRQVKLPPCNVKLFTWWIISIIRPTRKLWSCSLIFTQFLWWCTFCAT